MTFAVHSGLGRCSHLQTLTQDPAVTVCSCERDEYAKH